MAILDKKNAIILDPTKIGGITQTDKTKVVKGNFEVNQGFTVKGVATSDYDLTQSTNNIDGEAPQNGNKYLFTAQNDGTENGIYLLVDGTFVRDDVFDTLVEVNKTGFIYVTSGSSNADTHWKQTVTSPVIGTDALSFKDVFASVNVAANAVTVEKKLETGVASVSKGKAVALLVGNNDEVTLCDASSDVNDLSYVPEGIIVEGGDAGEKVKFVQTGEITLAADVFSAGDIGKNLWIDPESAGDYGLAEPTGTGEHYSLVGRISATDKIIVNGDPVDLGTVQ